MPGYIWRGVDTHRSYLYLNPPSVDPETGAPSTYIEVNGEVAITCNTDESMARGTAGRAPVQDIYAPGVVFSPWEMENP